jgi:hypothetical protein
VERGLSPRRPALRGRSGDDGEGGGVMATEERVQGHDCPRYLNARGELIDPKDQDGIGCPVCYPPDGRYRPAARAREVAA